MEEKNNEINKYILLISLKVYREQLLCCKQSYNLADYINNPIAKCTLAIINACENRSADSTQFDCDFVSSFLVYDYVKKNKELMEVHEIKKEMQLVESLMRIK
ncbi:hypothetical protein D3C80_1614920 [compost metagenome]